MQEHFFKQRGIAYRTNSFVPDRKTLVFVHGLSGSLSAWYPYEKLFEESYNLLTLDLRGHGLSLRPDRGGYAMKEYVEDLHALLAELGIARVCIVSHSFGTLVAMEFARANPRVAEQNIFLAPAYGVRAFWLSRVCTNLAAWLAILPLRLRKYGRTDYSRFYPTPDYSISRIGTDILNMGLRSYLWALSLVFARNYDSHWESLSMPSSIVHGTNDSIVPISHARSLAVKLPHSSLTEIQGANHILVLNNVEEVAGLIRNFIAQ